MGVHENGKVVCQRVQIGGHRHLGGQMQAMQSAQELYVRSDGAEILLHGGAAQA